MWHVVSYRSYPLDCTHVGAVKRKQPSISPSFHFLGQLMDFEEQLKRENTLIKTVDGAATVHLSGAIFESSMSPSLSSPGGSCDERRDFLDPQVHFLLSHNNRGPGEGSKALVKGVSEDAAGYQSSLSSMGEAGRDRSSSSARSSDGSQDKVARMTTAPTVRMSSSLTTDRFFFANDKQI